MGMLKRVSLFILVNILVIASLSLILNLFHIRPYLDANGIDYRALLIFCFIWGMGGAFISLALSRVMAKTMMRVKIIEERTASFEELKLLHTVHRLAKAGGLKIMPQVGIYPASEVNAFATGPTKSRSLVAVSQGLLQKMDQNSVEGVIAHEITHITNGDMVTMTLLQGVVNAFVMFLARVLAYVIAVASRPKNSNSSSPFSFLSYTLMVFVFEIIFMLFGWMIIAFFSRYREYRADKGGADLVGSEKMISALQSLKALLPIKAPQQVTSKSFQSMQISSAHKQSKLLDLFSTHPPLEQRIARLQKRS